MNPKQTQAATIQAAYYEFAMAPAGLAVVDDADVVKTTLCAACARVMRPGDRVGASVVMGKSRVSVHDAPHDGLVCDQCDETIAEEVCRGCSLYYVDDVRRRNDCICDEIAAEQNRPENAPLRIRGEWIQ